MVLPKPNLQHAPENMNSYSTLPQDEPHTVITRQSATQYLVLNSKDRFLQSQPSTSVDASGATITSAGTVSYQPWNNFKLQRPQNLMESFATRLLVSEIRFPYWIPNINERNNKIWITTQVNLSGTLVRVFEVVVPTGFYNPTDFKTALQDAMNSATVLIDTVPIGMKVPPLVSYINNAYIISVNPTNVEEFYIHFYDPLSITPEFAVPPKNVYLNNASMALTMGFDYSQVIGGVVVLTQIRGNITELLYTQFLDIVSDKYNYYTTNFDGSSDAVASKQLLARLYLADETSTYAGYKALYGPFLIHRQFKNGKAVHWNKNAVVDWLDIGIYDQFGQLVPLPIAPNPNAGFVPVSPTGSYPDFQITLLATEN
jgi:hypothetical protein